jgi:general secretion pathway protein A
MYTDFYNFKEKPFNLTPSSRFLYLGDVHREALALLTYGVMERKGFILLTGEVGAGKTTMIHALIEGLDKNMQYVYLSNPLFSVKDFVSYLAFSVFKKKVYIASKADFLIQFEGFLKEQLQHQKTFILIIDEAQKLSFELLEEIRLLSNMETADEKLINIFLVGQPELNEMLSRPECRPLLQRISIRYHIKALDFKGTCEYISTRLKMAGGENGERIIPKEVARVIYQYSGGYPRMINILADNALLLGYSRGETRLTPAMVKECYTDLQLDNSFLKGRADKMETSETAARRRLQIGSNWKWGAVLLFIIVVLGISLYVKRQEVFLRLPGLIPANRQEVSNVSSIEPILSEKDTDNIKVRGGITGVADGNNAIPDDSAKDQILNKIENKPETGGMEDSIRDKAYKSVETSVIVKEGDTLTELATNAYGYANDEILNLIQEHNPEIQDINIIEVGQTINFPPLSISEDGQSYTVHIASFIPFDNARELFQKLIKDGYEAYIVPAYNAQKGKLFRVTVGNFKSEEKARAYASQILEKGISDYAVAIRLEMK